MASEITGIMSGTGAKMKAEVGADSVTFRGAFKGDVPFEEIVAEARGTLLLLSFRGHAVELGAGARANQLAAKIRSPPSRLDRMGIGAGASAAVAGVVEATFRAELATRASVASGLPPSPVDVLVFGVATALHLDPLAKLGKLVDARGALWIIHPEPLQAKVLAAARTAGFLHAQTVRFAADHAASKFVHKH